ncbi:translation initiation factor IF-2 [Candidatus Gracilibacteria bacterium]|nr:translation initiation factor IF-2 [Candidatus Gracilibacteria bacterium]
MPDKTLVDDYYSHSNDSGNQNESNIKKKQVIKGKIKPKKQEDLGDISEQKKLDKKLSENLKKEENTFKDKQKPFKKPISFDVEKPQKEFVKKDFVKKDNNDNKGNNSFFKKPQENSNTFKKDFVKKDDNAFKNKEKPFKKPISFDVEKPQKEFVKKDFVKKDNNDNKGNNSFFKKPQENSNTFKKDFNKPNFSKPVKKGFEKTQEEQKKVFKKDKSFKHQKKFLEEQEEDTSFSRSTKIKPQKKQEKNIEDIVQNLTNRTGETVIIPEILSVKELSEKLGVPIMKLLTEFLKNGMKVNINSKIDYETALIIGEAFDIKVQKDISSGFGIEEVLSGDITTLLHEDDETLLKKRAPVISIMGHVDHGKTSLLDYLRKTKLADKEAGGITQKIGAYQVNYNGEKITFLDTPGHEAFTIMRARGAKSTDIAILVVAADEGVKPQTIESINHAREAGLKIVVAITKIDKPGANLDNVKSGLSANGLLSEDWGGDIPMVGISSKTGEGIDNLLEIILLVAEMEDFKANPDRFAVATVLESYLDTKMGPVSTLLINTGTLNKGDSIVCKGSYGKVKVLKNDLGKNIDHAGPSSPVLVVGLDSVCEGGDIVQVVLDIEKARTKALEYKELMSSKKSLSNSSIDMIMGKIKSGSLKQLKIVLKADTNGSLEAIKQTLLKLSTEDVKVNIIHTGVGSITQGDALMCSGSSAILVGYNVEVLGNAKNIIEDTKVEYISSKVIYHIAEKIEKIVNGMFDITTKEVIIGNAEVGGIFYEGEGFMILGLKLKIDSKIESKAKVKIIRGDKYLGEGVIENLKSGIIDVNDLEGPVECGIKLKTDIKLELKDSLEIFKLEVRK